MVMKGYYKKSKATEEVLSNGWFHSGDFGYMDEDGYLFITGRIKEVIVLSSGKNVYPDEVEKKYLNIPLIKEMCVLGAAEKGMVESLQAIIVPDFEYAKQSQIGNVQEALKWEINAISITLPEYMRIRGYTLHPGPLPRTPLGKLRRFVVEDMMKAKTEKVTTLREEDSDLMEDEIGRKVIRCIKPLLKENLPVSGKDNLELDLGLDSLAKVELIVALEMAFSIKLPETFASEIQTVSELVSKIKTYETKGVGEITNTPAWREILQTEPGIDDRNKVGLHLNIIERLIVFLGLLFVKTVTKILFRVKTKGIDNIPKNGPYIIAPNHVSYLDGFCVISGIPLKYFQSLYTLGGQQFFTGGVKESFARLAHIIPIDPETYLNRALRISSYVLRNEKSLLIFSEGGRSFDGKLMEFKKGVGILALELDVPVVPVYIKGSFEALPRTAIWPKFMKIELLFGRPLYPKDIDFSRKPEGKDSYQFFVDQVKERVKQLRDQESRSA
jgi:long-chain acyl-CoA synthetase